MAYNGPLETIQLKSPQHYSKWYGPYLVGLTVQMYLMGILTIQTWNYYLFFPKDRRIYKILVGVLFGASVFHCTTDFYLLYRGWAWGFGRTDYIMKYNWTYFYEPAWTGFIAAICQSFFLHRCFVITKSRIVAGVGVMGILLSMSASFALAVASSKVTYGFTENTIFLVTSAVVDMSISVILIWHLHRAKTGFHSTEKILVRVMKLAMETAAVTSIVAIGAAAASLAYGKLNGSHLAFDFVIARIYGCSVMVTLLSRQDIARDASGIHTTSGMHGTSATTHNRQPASGINITTTRVRVVDEPDSRGVVAYDIPMKSMNQSDDASVHDDKVAQFA